MHMQEKTPSLMFSQFAFLMVYFINGLMACWHVKSGLEGNASVHNIELTCLSETVIYGYKICCLLQFQEHVRANKCFATFSFPIKVYKKSIT
jgi:hypothetical protein